MNKIEFSKLKNKEDKGIAFNQLKDDYKMLFNERDKLQSNWKALKEWLEDNWKSSQDIWFVKIITKMNELEGDK